MKQYRTFIIITLMILFGISNAHSENWNIEPITTFKVSGGYEGFVSGGDYIYSANSWGIMVNRYVQGEDDEPQLIGRYPTTGNSKGLFLVDTLLYFIDQTKGLRIWSVADPENLFEVGFCADPLDYERIIVRDDYLYALTDYSTHGRIGFRIFSVEDPTNPQLCGFIQYLPRTRVRDFKISGNHAYISGRGVDYPVLSTLRVVNIEDPDNPFEVDCYNLDESNFSSGIEIFNDTLMIMTGDLHLFSIENPDSLEVLHIIEDTSFMSSYFVHRRGYIYSIGLNFRFADFRDVNNPELISELRRPSSSTSSNLSYLSEDYLFASLGDYGWNIIDFSRRRNPNIEYTTPESECGFIWSVAKRGNYLFLADALDVDNEEDDEVNRFRVLSIEDPVNPVEVSSVNTGCGINKIEIVDNTAFVGGSFCGLTSIDISDPEDAQFLDIEPRTYARDFVIQGDYAYVNGYYDITVFSIADPSAITYLDTYDPYEEEQNGEYHRLQISNNLLVIAGRIPGEGGYHFWTYDASDPENLTILGDCRIDLGSAAKSLEIFDNYAYISSSRGISILSLATPQNPELIHQDISRVSSRLYLFEDKLIAGSSASGILVYSLENPERPVLTGEYDVPSYAIGICIEDDIGYVAGGYDVTSYDLSRALEGWDFAFSEEEHDFGEVSVDSTSVWDLTATNRSEESHRITRISLESEVFSYHFGWQIIIPPDSSVTIAITFNPRIADQFDAPLIISTEDQDYEIILSGSGVILGIEEEKHIPGNFCIQSSYPNPFNSSTKIQYNLPQDELVKVTIHNLRGAVVKELINNQQNAGSHTLTWDSTNASSGIYFCRLESGDKTTSLKLTLVK